MALAAKLELRQGQQLVMTPQLQQAIRLLQLSNLELNAFVDAELERNPLLEREEGDEGSPTGEGTPGSGDADVAAGEDLDGALDLSTPRVDAAAAHDTEFDNVFPEAAASTDIAPDSGWASLRVRTSSADADEFNPEAFVASEPSLRDHLVAQMQLAFAGAPERLIAQHLIDHVDESGYITTGVDAIANRLGAAPSAVESVLATLQTFEPSGVCARNLAECLALQLKDRNRFDPVIERLLANLHLLAEHNLMQLRRVVGCDMTELSEMIAEIKQLSPKPGLKYGSVQMQPVVPDVLVRAAADGSFIVELNSDTLPRVLVNRTYYVRVSKTACNPKDKNYLLECLQTANWLTKSLDQRARTILRVAEEIVRQQDGFFMHGVRHLRPLNLRTVADAISMHESTVSRVTSNKYMATPRGIFELKYFFTSAIPASGNGEAFSSEAVRHRIRQLIDGETAVSIMSDDTIVEKLRGDGIEIARRTVAKYREAMHIPSSVQRRRAKRLPQRAVGHFR